MTPLDANEHRIILAALETYQSMWAVAVAEARREEDPIDERLMQGRYDEAGELLAKFREDAAPSERTEKDRHSREARDRIEAEYDAEHGEGAYKRWREAKAEEARTITRAHEYDAIRDEVLRRAGRVFLVEPKDGNVPAEVADRQRRAYAELLDASIAAEQASDRELARR